jgi:hypothetical protein
MKKLLVITAIIAIIASGSLLTGCVKVDLSEKNGPVTTRTYGFTDFTGIDIGHCFELVVTHSDNYTVSITGGENILDHTSIHLDGATLVFCMEGWTDVWFSSWFDSPKVTITMPVLTKLHLSGASNGDVSGFHSSQDLGVEVSGASELNINATMGFFTADVSGASTLNGIIYATGSAIELSGASHSNLIGTGGNTRLSASGASSANMPGFTVNNAFIELSGASHARLEINGRLDVDLSGASSVEYSGSTILGEIDLSGASSITRVTG